MKHHYACKTGISKLELQSEMSILAGKPKLTSWEVEFDRAGWEIQNKVTKLFVKIFKF